MLFKYTSIDKEGNEKEGSIEAVNKDAAINSLQKRDLTIVSIESEEKSKSILKTNIKWFERVSNRDLVILSRQIATFFEAEVSALRVFKTLSAEVENPKLQRVLDDIVGDLEGGSSISDALWEHPDVFSDFYVNMVQGGEASGNLHDVFGSLADHLERSYELTNKVRNALVYPIFVIATFIIVMSLMLTIVIPRVTAILEDSGQEVPIYTKIVIGISDFLIDYGILVLILLSLLGVFLWKYAQSETGRKSLDYFKFDIPYIGSLYKKVYLARISDNMSTMLSSGISMVNSLGVTKRTVGSPVFEDILEEVTEDVKGGSSLEEAFSKHDEIPSIMVQMLSIGEETGKLKNILNTLSKFYQQEVKNAVDTLINLIEPILIVALGLGVAVLLASVLMPIYNMSSAI